MFFLLLTVLCFYNAHRCDYEIRIYKRYGTEQKAPIILVNKRKVRGDSIRSPYIMWYDIYVEMKLENGEPVKQMISTQNRKAKKYLNAEYADIITINPIQVHNCNIRYCIIKEDLKSTNNKVLSLLLGCIFFVLSLLTIIGYFV